MPMMTTSELSAFGAQAGSISEITDREATGDRSVTLDRHDKQVLFSRIPKGSYARKGGAASNHNPDQHNFLVFPRDAVSGAKPHNVPVVHPKKEGNELRLYGSAGTGLDLRTGDFFYVLVRDGEPLPFIGTISPKERAKLLGHPAKGPSMSGKPSTFDDEEEDTAYQQAIGDTAARMPVGFTGKRYPRDPQVALKALKKAKFLCEAAPDKETHETFVSATTGQPYVEAHHLVPLSRQGNYSAGLDIVENITALCPNCHRRLHHGAPGQRIQSLLTLLKKRKSALSKQGLDIDEAGLMEAYGIDTAHLLKYFGAV